MPRRSILRKLLVLGLATLAAPFVAATTDLTFSLHNPSSPNPTGTVSGFRAAGTAGKLPVIGNSIFMLGGLSGDYASISNDIVRSDDFGVTWTSVGHLPDSYGHWKVCSDQFNGQTIFVTGYTGSNVYDQFNPMNVYTSTDNINFVKLNTVDWPGHSDGSMHRQSLSCGIANGKFVFFNGQPNVGWNNANAGASYDATNTQAYKDVWQIDVATGAWSKQADGPWYYNPRDGATAVMRKAETGHTYDVIFTAQDSYSEVVNNNDQWPNGQYAQYDKFGIWRSNNAGASWTQIPITPFHRDHHAFVLSMWTYKTSLYVYVTHFDPNTAYDYYAIWRSNDEGLNWEEVSVHPSNPLFRATNVATAVVGNQVVLSGFYDQNPGYATATYTAVLPASSVVGDPVFTGFNGEVYQVHGVPGDVYSIVSASSLQFSTRFSFLANGRNAGQLAAIRQKHANKTLPVTAAWTHPGTYFTEIGFLFSSAGNSLRAVAGKYEHGLKHVELTCAAPNAISMNMKDIQSKLADGLRVLVQCADTEIEFLNHHVIIVDSPDFRFRVENSDHFFNIAQAEVNPALTAAELDQLEGLLGVTARKSFSMKSQLSAEFVDEYRASKEAGVLATDFMHNRFQQA
jgi:hypothetical protein